MTLALTRQELTVYPPTVFSGHALRAFRLLAMRVGNLGEGRMPDVWWPPHWRGRRHAVAVGPGAGQQAGEAVQQVRGESWHRDPGADQAAVQDDHQMTPPPRRVPPIPGLDSAAPRASLSPSSRAVARIGHPPRVPPFSAKP
jgi:hypothetical protein